MADLNDAKKFAHNVYNPKYEELIRQRDQQLANASARRAAQGSVVSSGMVQEAAEIFAEAIYKVLHARADALLEGIELYGIPIDEVSTIISKELEQLKCELVRTSAIVLRGFRLRGPSKCVLGRPFRQSRGSGIE